MPNYLSQLNRLLTGEMDAAAAQLAWDESALPWRRFHGGSHDGLPGPAPAAGPIPLASLDTVKTSGVRSQSPLKKRPSLREQRSCW